MSSIKIVSEGKPNRCEICHQQDLFDSNYNNCLRCFDVLNKLTRNEQQSFIKQEAILLNNFCWHVSNSTYINFINKLLTSSLTIILLILIHFGMLEDQVKETYDDYMWGNVCGSGGYTFSDYIYVGTLIIIFSTAAGFITYLSNRSSNKLFPLKSFYKEINL